MSSFLTRLLRGSEPSLEELREACAQSERRRNEKQLALEKLLLRRDDIIERMKKARSRRDDLKVDILWNELLALRPELAMVRRELRTANLEYLTLKRYTAGMEALAARGDRQGTKKLLGRLRRSRLPELLARADIEEERYLEELDLVMAEDGSFEEETAGEDPRKEAFLQKLDGVRRAEEAGDLAEAKRREAALKQELDDGIL